MVFPSVLYPNNGLDQSQIPFLSIIGLFVLEVKPLLYCSSILSSKNDFPNPCIPHIETTPNSLFKFFIIFSHCGFKLKAKSLYYMCHYLVFMFYIF